MPRKRILKLSHACLIVTFFLACMRMDTSTSRRMATRRQSMKTPLVVKHRKNIVIESTV